MRLSSLARCVTRNLPGRISGSITSTKGGALIELALVIPVLFLVLLGAVQFGYVEYASIEVSNAALAGVQYGGQNAVAAADITGIGNAAQSDAPNITLGPTTVSHACTCANGSASTCLPTDCTGSNIETILTVQTQATVKSLVTVPGLPSTYTVHGQAIQKVLE